MITRNQIQINETQLIHKTISYGCCVYRLATCKDLDKTITDENVFSLRQLVYTGTQLSNYCVKTINVSEIIHS